MNETEVKRLVGELSPIGKELLRDHINEGYGVSRFLGKHVDEALLRYVVELLDGREPMPLWSRRQPSRIRIGLRNNKLKLEVK